MQDIDSCMRSHERDLIATVGNDLLTVGTKKEDGHHLGRANLYGAVADR
jgi:hypothetical protein